MDALKLIGKVACNRIRLLIERDGDELDLALLLLRRLSIDEVAAIAIAVCDDPDLKARVEVQVPRYCMAGVPGIREDMLTDLSATELRTAPCTKESRLFALFDDSQAQGLSQVEKISKDLLLDQEFSGMWVDEVMRGSSSDLLAAVKPIWAAALKGLFLLDQLSLHDAAAYVCEVRRLLDEGGLSIRKALGKALWVIQLPSFGGAFDTITDLKTTHASEWKRKYASHWLNQCYFLKRNKQQASYSKQELTDSLERAQEQLTDPVRAALRAFIDAGDGWTMASQNLAKLDWEEVRLFFEGVGRPDARTLGELTRQHFELLDPDSLNEADRDYIERLVERDKRPVKNEEDEKFYVDHQVAIQREPSLAAQWDRFIFGNEVTCDNFTEGLIDCIRRLLPARQEIAGRVILEVTAEENEKLKFKMKNEAACRSFQSQYSGLETLLSGVAVFRKLVAFQYDQVYEDLKAQNGFKPDSAAKRALQLGFRVLIRSATDENTKTGVLRLCWTFDPQTVLVGYADDLERLQQFMVKKGRSPLVRCHATRSLGYGDSQGKTLSLMDVSGFEATGRSERGAFVPAVSRVQHLGTEWRDALSRMTAKGFFGTELRHRLEEQFQAFEQSYTEAIQALLAGQLAAASHQMQAEAYAGLVQLTVTHVRADEARHCLLRPILEIGVASVSGPTGSEPTAIVCPWHPLRLQATAAKSRQFQRTCQLLLHEESPAFTDGGGDLFFRETAEWLRLPGAPEVVLAWQGAQPTLLSQTDSLHEYSLHESPVSDENRFCSTHESPQDTARTIAAIVESYLTLQPHERDNFSIVLYNCDSALLPQAVVESIRTASDGEAHDAMCQVILTHNNKKQLRHMYERISAQEGDDDAFHVSESSRDFMARVRINIMVDEAPTPDPKSGQPTDIVFCQDVISRQAESGWARAPRTVNTFAPDELKPHQWSRRREMQRGDRESVVYLTCPAQTAEGWSYLLGLSALCHSEYALESWEHGQCQIPARKLNFDHESTSHIFKQTHDLGNWVVNLDELLDRRLLRDRDIKVIRYRQSATRGRNLVISSTASDALLRATLHNKLDALLPENTPSEHLDELCQKFISRANDISGQLVLRAARRGSSTHELLGLVLSMHLVRGELGEGRQIACFLLDDYATWLGQTEGQVADLLVLSPSIGPTGEKQLDVIVTEAKFILFDQLAGKARESSKQLNDSLSRIEAALFGSPIPADQDIWLARLADLLLEGLHVTEGQSFNMSEWRSAIRRRQCRVCLRGYSHVFVHGPVERGTEGGKYCRVAGTKNGHQECFSRADVRSFIQSVMTGAYGDTTAKRVAQAGYDFTARDYHAINGGESGPPPDGPTGGNESGPRGPRPSPVLPVSPASPTALAMTRPAGIASGSGEVDTPIPGPSCVITPLPGDGSVVGRQHLAGFGEKFGATLIARSAADQRDETADAWLDDTASKMRLALQKREMTAKLLEKKLTPNAALVKFQGTDDLTIAKFEAKLSEFKTTDGLEIIGVRAELGKIAVSIARRKREILQLQEVWKRWLPDHAFGNTKLLIGVKESDNDLLFLTPDVNPHTLVAGITNSGKSVLIQNIILAIAATNTPSQAKLIIIDPKKGVDYFAFRDLPHLARPVIKDAESSLACLGEVVEEMHNRYEKFGETGAKNIGSYIKKTGQVLPRIWVVHDEFAVWMQDESYRDSVTSLVNQLSVEARAAGIYLIFAAQRPDNTVFPMQLRSNLGNRLVLKVDTEATSEIAIGIKKGGAERLLGHGHLAALIDGNPEPIYAQVPYISEDDLEELVKAIQQDNAAGSQ